MIGACTFRAVPAKVQWIVARGGLKVFSSFVQGKRRALTNSNKDLNKSLRRDSLKINGKRSKDYLNLFRFP